MRWFLFVNLNALHMPYTAPRRYWKRVEELAPDAGDWPRQRRGYLAELAYTDAHLGRILGVLDETGQRARTLIVVSADHGEIMDPAHDRLSAIRDKRSLYHHGITPFDEELLVPLTFVAPGALPADRRVVEQAQCLDIAPTLHELLGLPPEPRHRGQSLAGVLLRGEPLAERPIRTVGRFYQSVRTGRLKYVHHEVRRGGVWRTLGHEELYDLAVDPLEHRDLAPSGDPRLAQSRGLLEELEAEFAKPRAAAAPAAGEASPVEDLHLDQGVDPEIEKLLGEWGYL